MKETIGSDNEHPSQKEASSHSAYVVDTKLTADVFACWWNVTLDFFSRVLCMTNGPTSRRAGGAVPATTSAGLVRFQK